jgi:hypothetical protein
MLEALIILFFLAWLLGFGFHVGGDLVHLLLVVCLVCVVYRLITGRRV